jgi:hypothetical protein
MTQTQLERINMDPLDKLANDIAAASSPFQLGRDWADLQAGFAALMAWKQATQARLAALETQIKQLASAGA